MYFPSFRPRGITAGATLSSQSYATVELRNGQAFLLALDPERSAYLRDCLKERGARGRPDLVWFETVDGCLVGLNLDQVNLVSWGGAGIDAAARIDWDHAHVVVHFADGEPVALARINGDEIDRLRGASLPNRRRPPFYTLRAPDDAEVAINFEPLTYVTMPAAWLDDE